ncbi:6-phosphogluconolactonase [Kribbella amoyensis]|uniref:6-phosphogluconolactonase n=1 Tax=Kribbella amoyensis TaxID=996641 RepID=A0A561BW57_9ACTN|nr:lactonase family protein [Kribbella amoyensis]TWD83091.1 6-phosphogluconolactonase [Kribbella amoyensis]
MTSRRTFLGLGATAVGTAIVGAPTARAAESQTLYIGAYAPGGLGVATYDPASGMITSTGVLAGVAEPSLLIGTDRFLYAVNEQPDGGVTAIAVDAPGKLRILNRQPTGGSAPCHLALVAKGNYLLSANYGSGDVAVHPVNADGSLGERTDLVQHEGAAPHAHQVVEDPAGEYVLAVDLGTDSVYTYELSTAGKLALQATATMNEGAGPRHLAFHPSGVYAYVANELDSTITICGYDAGRLTPGTSLPTTPPGAPQNYPGEVLVSPDGRFVYLTNRGHNSIAVFAVEAGGAELRLVDTPSCGGDWPRHCGLDKSGALLFVANQRSNTITTFHRNQQTGTLTPAAEFSTPVPACTLSRSGR